LKNHIKNRITLSTLVFIFALYNLNIYFDSVSASVVSPLSITALEGQLLWQKNNCTACHQLYGLGGYLGPDLTNIVSNPLKGAEYTKALLNSGIKSMPKFNFTEQEKNNLIEFFKAVDKTGYYPNKEATFNNIGWVSIKYK